MDRIARMQAVVDAAFLAHGTDALYTAPDGAETACRIIPHRYVRDRPKGGVMFTGGGQMLELDSREVDVMVRASQIAQPETGGVFRGPVVAGVLAQPHRTWTMGDMPLAHDTLGLVWRCSAEAA